MKQITLINYMSIPTTRVQLALLSVKRSLGLLGTKEAIAPDETPVADAIEAAAVTNFPSKGDNSAVSLRSSQWEQFPLDVAENLKNSYPEIWRLGGNIKGNAQYSILSGIARRGGSPSTQAEENAIRLREAWVARHYRDHLIAGVIAQVKWLAIGELGKEGMMKVINQRKELVDKRRSRAAKRKK